MNLFRRIALLVSLLPACCAVRAQNPQPVSLPVTIVERTETPFGAVVARLSNGLRVVIQPMHTAPVVSVHVFVRAGGIYEGEWLGCGLSHLVEHLVAEYSTSQPESGHLRASRAGAVSRLEQIGGQANAFTSADHTAYYISAVSSRTDECLDLMLGQIVRPDISEEDFRREHGVVQRELEMGLDDPLRIAWYLHQENLYRGHPAGVPVIGYAEPLSRATYADARAYHARMYVPQNMVLAVAGDVEVDRVLDRVLQGVRSFPAGRTPVLAVPEVPPLVGLRRVEARHKAFRETHQFMSFRTVSLFDPDLYPLDVLSTILSRGESSRLVRTLQYEKRLVTAVETWSGTPPWGRGDFTISFRTRPADADRAEAAVKDELRRVIDEGVAPEELARARRQMTADHVRRRQTAESIAAMLGGDLLTTGDVSFSENYTKRIQAVSAEQVRAAAKKYFRFEDMAVTRLSPQTQPASAAPQTRSAAVAAREEVYTLPNGLRVVLCPSKEVGLAAMALVCRGGLLLETPETNGLGNLLALLSTRGAGRRRGDEIAELFSRAGGSISALCGDNSLLWEASVLADDVLPALDAFADVVLQPTFPPKELEALRPLVEAQIRRREEHWFTRLEKFFRAKFFAGTPWALLPEGRREVVQKASPERLKEYHRRVVRAGSSVLAVYGNFDPAAVRALIARRFQAMPGGEGPAVSFAARRVAAGGETHVLPTHTKQAGVIVAAPATTVSDLSRRLPLMLLDTILSGYSLPSGWLHEELRGKKLVYVVHACHKTGFAPGAFLVYAGTQPEQAKEVVGIIRNNLRKAARYTPSREELDRAIASILTSEILDNQTVDALARNAALNELYGLGADWPRRLEEQLRAITPEQVRAEARRLLDDGLVVTVITPQPERFSVEKPAAPRKQPNSR